MLLAKSVSPFVKKAITHQRGDHTRPKNLLPGSFGGRNQLPYSQRMLGQHHNDALSTENNAEIPRIQNLGISSGPRTSKRDNGTGIPKHDDGGPSSSHSKTSARGIQSRAFEEDDFRGKGSRRNSGKRDKAPPDRIYALGRLLTTILRHRAVELNLKIRDDGYVAVNDILKLPIKTMAGLPLTVYTVEDVKKAVEQDNKQRYGLLTEDDVLLIRANQGHSINVVESEKLLKPVHSADEIPVCVHGTKMSNLDSILRTGLKKMQRNHVHFATGLPKEDGVISGMRFSSDILIYLDVEKALQDGMKLYISDNGVVLTEGFAGVVPPKYFSKVAKFHKGKITPLPFDAQRAIGAGLIYSLCDSFTISDKLVIATVEN